MSHIVPRASVLIASVQVASVRKANVPIASVLVASVSRASIPKAGVSIASVRVVPKASGVLIASFLVANVY